MGTYLALIFQWIEYELAELAIEVRLLLRAQKEKPSRRVEGGAATAASGALRNFQQKITEGRTPLEGTLSFLH